LNLLALKIKIAELLLQGLPTKNVLPLWARADSSTLFPSLRAAAAE
jgi:hypothetical protein